MKRILFVHQTSAIGGGSYCLLNILREIDKSMIEPVVCLASDGPLRKEIESLKISVVFFRKMVDIPYNKNLWSIYSLLQYFKVKKSISAFQSLLQSSRIDVVYLNNMMLYNYLKSAKKCGCKTILHIREHWPLDEHTIQLQWARKYVYKYADEIIAINKYSASVFPDKKSTIVYDWIDFSDRYEPISMNDLFGENVSDCKIFLFTGGIQRIKGAYEVVKTFSDCISNRNYRLLLLGYDIQKPMKGFVGMLKKILYSLGFDINEIKIRKVVADDKRIKCISSRYKILDIIKQSYCCVSYFTIPHANLTLAESLMLGIPIIAAKTEETDEYSGNGHNAILFEINNLCEFEDRMKHIDSYIVVDKNKQEKNTLLLTNIFSKEKNVKRINSVVNNLINHI